MSAWIQVARAGRVAARQSWVRSINVRAVFVPVLLLAGILSLLYLNQASDLASTSYDVAALQNERRIWEIRNDQLRLQIAELESLDRIDREASARLGMGPPQRVIYAREAAPSAASPLGSSPASPTPSIAPARSTLESVRLRLESLLRGVSGGP